MASVSSKVRKAVDDATESNPDLQAQVAALKEDIANIAATLAKRRIFFIIKICFLSNYSGVQFF